MEGRRLQEGQDAIIYRWPRQLHHVINQRFFAR
jgi:hypothetical protein